MTSHFFLLSASLDKERITWIGECLKYYFVRLYPETLMHRAKSDAPAFTFLMTGDALYSLQDPEILPGWEIVLSLPSVRIVCDRQELDLRGISVERLKMKYTDQVVDQNSLGLNGKPSFWRDVATIARQNKPPIPSTIGFLQLESPYMHRSAEYALQLLSAALEIQSSIDLYAYMDGVHCGHTGQEPTEFANIGRGLEELSSKAAKRNLQCRMIACARCAAARGYSTWDDGKGVIVSTCSIKPFRIRNIGEITGRFRSNHVILSDTAGSVQLRKGSAPDLSSLGAEIGRNPPPILILVTKSPYGTETTFGALSFATACAHEGIATRVVFIEEGVLSLAGNHKLAGESTMLNMQEVINAVAGSPNLNFFAFVPSIEKRGLHKNKALTAVIDIGYQELGQIIFGQPASVQSDHQRIVIF